VNLYAGELGYYQFEECGDATNPVLGLEVGKTYEFVQTDPSNYYHPLGLAYFPDGAHADADELEPGIVPPGSSSTCDVDMSCPAPMYYMEKEYQGTYSNNADLVDVSSGEDNFGLDEYEPLFFHPLPEWIGYGKFSVFLKFDEDTDYTKDIFYFCHIHQFMTGRIKLLKDGQPLQEDAELPELGYEYDQPAEHDEVCGTYGLHDFQLPHSECPERFVCDAPAENEELVQFSSCIDSMNCAMMNGMTTSVKGSESEVALFLHQMIPHHQNAVNMAKALMKTKKVQCDDLTDEESEQAVDCGLEIILREIINGQNHQIQAMRGLLDAKSYPEENDCKVTINSSAADIFPVAPSSISDTSSTSNLYEDVTNETGGICYATCAVDEVTGKEVCTFTTKVNLYAGELGYYQFEECGDATNPVLGLEVGKTYEFVQTDPSNYYHPLGLAYFPDGAHADADELEPGIVPPGSSSTCDVDMSCPAPMYYMEKEYQGTYSNNADLVDVSSGEDNFGLDEYEPLFFHPLPEWIGYGKFSVFLKFDEDTDYTKDIFYFCHIHQFMTGRIKLLKDGQPLQEDAELPELGYEYDQPAEHDEVCGTYGLHDFQLPHSECPERFVCDAPAENEELVQFSSCIDSMNCAMMNGMTTSVKGSESEVALFLHQMIPHHQNAVNMAKALMKTKKVQCDDLTDEESEQAVDCGLEIILREIINGQNHQIQAMRGLLDAKSYPEENDCKVTMNSNVFNTAASVAPSPSLKSPLISIDDALDAVGSDSSPVSPPTPFPTPALRSPPFSDTFTSGAHGNSLTTTLVAVIATCLFMF